MRRPVCLCALAVLVALALLGCVLCDELTWEEEVEEWMDETVATWNTWAQAQNEASPDAVVQYPVFDWDLNDESKAYALGMSVVVPSEEEVVEDGQKKMVRNIETKQKAYGRTTFDEVTADNLDDDNTSTSS
ncbi:hypothetical protein KIPB_011130, partial [Kipferlia bialata]|eukprot:g11130.t1